MKLAGGAALSLCLAAAALLFLLPLYVVVTTAFKPLAEVLAGSVLAWPQRWTAEPLLRAWSSACIGAECQGLRPGFLNSLRIAVPATCASVMLGAVNGYALTKWRLPGAHAMFGVLLAANFMPYQVILLPLALLLRQLSLFGTVQGLILVHIAYGMPYVTLLFRNFYLGIPDEVIGAARLDGGRFWSIFFHIVLPLSAPMLADCGDAAIQRDLERLPVRPDFWRPRRPGHGAAQQPDQRPDRRRRNTT